MSTVLEQYEEARNKVENTKKTIDNNTLTPHDLLRNFFDEDTFVEIKAFASHDFRDKEQKKLGDGVVTAYGQINGRLVYAYCDDNTYMDGSMGVAHGQKIKNMISLAVRTGSPIVCITDSKGMRLEEDLFALDAQNKIYNALSLASGVVPIISVLAGDSSGTSTFLHSLADFVFMAGTSFMYLATPTVTNALNNIEVTLEKDFNSKIQVREYGNAHFEYQTLTETMQNVKLLLEFLPSNNIDSIPCNSTDDPNRLCDVSEIVNEDIRIYDMKDVIGNVFDIDQSLSFMDTYAENIITSFQKLDGMTVGVIANNPLYKDGEIDSRACRKASRFINVCDSFNIPLITLVDSKGFVANDLFEQNELISSGSKLIKCYSNSTSTKITLIIGDAIGFGYSCMCPQSLGADLVYALPTATIGVVPAPVYVSCVYDSIIQNSDNPKETRETLAATFKEDGQSALAAAKKGIIDDIIDANSVRQRLIDAVYTLNSKRVLRLPKKHANFPL